MQLTIVLVILCIGSALSRSVRSTDRNLGDNVTSNCDIVRPFFDRNNVTIDFTTITQDDVTASTCGGSCCNRDAEDQLRQQAKADFHNLIHHHSRSLQGLLATTADALRETVTSLARQSENKTLILFEQVYRSMSLLSRPSIKALYQAMIDYVAPSNTADTLQQPLTREMLQKRFTDFFTRLFPIAYHHAVSPHPQDFTDKFKTCLYDSIDEIQPFGDIPKQISRSVSKSLEATRVLVQALTLGKTVLYKTDTVLFYGTSPQQAACYEALLRMTYCPKCSGYGSSVRPCSGFCTNVMRGCLTEPASEIDLAWSGYVETVERLVVAVDGRTDPLGLNAERAVRQLDTRISDAIMHAMENGPSLQEKVRQLCGSSELKPEEISSEHKQSESASSSESQSSLPSSSFSTSLEDRLAAVPHPNSQGHRALPTQLHVQLGNFLASIVRSRTFYGTLADAICEEYPDRDCWNGQRIGEYTKTVVDSSLTAQKYNPEFTMSTSVGTTSYGNSNTIALIDQLRHINQAVQSQLASAPDSGVLLSDEALDGSGSGSNPNWNRGIVVNSDDEGLDDDDNEASGSGMGPSHIDDTIVTHRTDEENSVTPTSGASITKATTLVLISFIWLI